MIHSICDFCGKDTDRNATLLSLTPFQNFARYHSDNQPFGYTGKTRSFVICHECAEKHGLPNPYHDYVTIQSQTCSYEHTLDNYTAMDKEADTARIVARSKAMEKQKPATIAASDAPELIGQLIDQLDDFLAAKSGGPEDKVILAGKDYQAIRDAFAGTLANWHVIETEKSGENTGS